MNKGTYTFVSVKSIFLLICDIFGEISQAISVFCLCECKQCKLKKFPQHENERKEAFKLKQHEESLGVLCVTSTRNESNLRLVCKFAAALKLLLVLKHQQNKAQMKLAQFSFEAANINYKLMNVFLQQAAKNIKGSNFYCANKTKNIQMNREILLSEKKNVWLQKGFFFHGTFFFGIFFILFKLMLLLSEHFFALQKGLFICQREDEIYLFRNKSRRKNAKN